MRLVSALVAGLLVVSPVLAEESKVGPAAGGAKPQAAAPAAVADDPKAPAPEDKPHIDVVFCIDCSGSMGPVIETAKQKVWAIVNEVARAKPAPVLRIGLLGYGDHDQQYRPFELTDDLDEVYKNLMTFKDEHWGAEFVGLAVHKATNEFKWSPAKDGQQVLRVIYVVGNETARQGPAEFDYTRTAPAAIAKGIQVNAIYCGNQELQTASPTWREMAKLADGQYMEIAGSGGAVVLATPFDDQLDALNARLNATYIGYGARARAGAANQVEQDDNARRLGKSVAAERAAAKGSGLYANARWDLVDAWREKDFDWKKIPEDQLPEEMRKMTAKQRTAYVEKKAKEREAVQAEIKELAAKRAGYLKEETAKKGLNDDQAFDKAVRKSIEAQASEKGFSFEE